MRPNNNNICTFLSHRRHFKSHFLDKPRLIGCPFGSSPAPIPIQNLSGAGFYRLNDASCHLNSPVKHQIKSNLFCHKFGTQYNNEFALHLAGQTGDNFALMSAHDMVAEN